MESNYNQYEFQDFKDLGGRLFEASIKKAIESNVISFLDKDLHGVQTPHDDTIIISIMTMNYDVKRIQLIMKAPKMCYFMMLSLR